MRGARPSRRRRGTGRLVPAVPPDGEGRPRRGATSRLTSRPTPGELAAAVERRAQVPDIVAPGLDVLFCGINPGRWSGAVGHHFAHPGNRFWKALHRSGFTGRQLAPAEELVLLDHRLGITNLVGRTTAGAADLDATELRAGAVALERKVRRFRPGAVAFLGMTAYRVAFGHPRAAAGRQAEPLADAVVWVIPNPSGLQAAYGLDDVVEHLRALRAFVRAARRGRPA